MDELLTRTEAAAALRISVRQLLRLTKAGDLATVRIGRAVRFRQQDIAAFAKRGGTKEIGHE